MYEATGQPSLQTTCLHKKDATVGLQSISTKSTQKVDEDKCRINFFSLSSEQILYFILHAIVPLLIFPFQKMSFRAYFVLIVGIFAVRQSMSTNYTYPHTHSRREKAQHNKRVH